MNIDKMIGLATAIGAAVTSAIQYRRTRDTEVELRERIVRLETEIVHMQEMIRECASISPT